jgi:hypothetical protein
LVGRGGRGLRERAHAVQHLLEHVAQVGELTEDAGELLVDCRAPLLHSVQQVQGCDAVGVGFVHPLHVIVDPAGRFANLLDLLPDGFGEDRVFGAPCACSAGQVSTFFWRLAMNSVASRPLGGARGLIVGPGGVRFGLAATSVAAGGVGLGGPVGVFSGPAGVGFGRLSSVVESPPGVRGPLELGRWCIVGLVLIFHKRVHVGMQVRGRRLTRLSLGLTGACHAWVFLRKECGTCETGPNNKCTVICPIVCTDRVHRSNATMCPICQV